MRQYLQMFLQPENPRRLPTARPTFGRNFEGIRPLERLLLRVVGLAADRESAQQSIVALQDTWRDARWRRYRCSVLLYQAKELNQCADIALQQPTHQMRKAFDRLRVRRECFLIKHSEDDNGTKAIVLTFSKKMDARDLSFIVHVRERTHLQFSHVRHAGFVSPFACAWEVVEQGRLPLVHDPPGERAVGAPSCCSCTKARTSSSVESCATHAQRALGVTQGVLRTPLTIRRVFFWSNKCNRI